MLYQLEKLEKHIETEKSNEIDRMLCSYDPTTEFMNMEEKRKFLSDNNLYLGEEQVDEDTINYYLVQSNKDAKDKILLGFALTIDYINKTTTISTARRKTNNGDFEL